MHGVRKITPIYYSSPEEEEEEQPLPWLPSWRRRQLALLCMAAAILFSAMVFSLSSSPLSLLILKVFCLAGLIAD